MGNSIVSASQPSAGEKALEAVNAFGGEVGKAADQGARNITDAIGNSIQGGFADLANSAFTSVGNLSFASSQSSYLSDAGVALADRFVQRSDYYGAKADNISQLQSDFRAQASQYRDALSAVRDRRFEIGNAQAAADFNAVGVSGWQVDLNDDATRYAVATGIAIKDNQQLTSIALGITALPTLFLGGGAFAAGKTGFNVASKFLKTSGLVGGFTGATANVAATYAFNPTADFGDYAQAGFTGFVGGAIAGRVGGYKGALRL